MVLIFQLGVVMFLFAIVFAAIRDSENIKHINTPCIIRILEGFLWPVWKPNLCLDLFTAFS